MFFSQFRICPLIVLKVAKLLSGVMSKRLTPRAIFRMLLATYIACGYTIKNRKRKYCYSTVCVKQLFSLDR